MFVVLKAAEGFFNGDVLKFAGARKSEAAAERLAAKLPENSNFILFDVAKNDMSYGYVENAQIEWY